MRKVFNFYAYDKFLILFLILIFFLRLSFKHKTKNVYNVDHELEDLKKETDDNI